MQRRSVLAGVAVALAGCATEGGRERDDGQERDSGEVAGGSDRQEAAEADPSAFDPDAIEERFIERFNAMRSERSLADVHRDRFLSEMGQAHAENMAEHDYVGHTQPDGTGITDRYQDRGLLPDCEIEAGNGGEYYPGAENAAKTHIGEVEGPNGEPVTVLDNADVAAILLEMWMASDEHRPLMVLPAVDAVGLGVTIRDDGAVFAALEFC